MADQCTHRGNVCDNLQLLADFGCVSTAFLVPEEGTLKVVAAASPSVVPTAVPRRRIGEVIVRVVDQEAYESYSTGRLVVGTSTRQVGGVTFTTIAYPIGRFPLCGIVIRDVPVGLTRGFGPMETAFTEIALKLLTVLRECPLRDVETYEPFATSRVAGDGVIYLGDQSTQLYVSPNISTILRLSSITDAVESLRQVSAYDKGIMSVLAGAGCYADEIEWVGQVLRVRAIPLKPGALILMNDITKQHLYEREMRVKEMTIREVHHRVKNNFQTVEALLRMQMRRSGSDEVRSALAEVVTRVESMAIAHDMLSYADDEQIDVVTMAKTIAQRVRFGLVGDSCAVVLTVEGEAVEMDARHATSTALALAEMVHNAIEHGIKDRGTGHVAILFRYEGGTQ
jgi:two-component sensor histidine kinase